MKNRSLRIPRSRGEGDVGFRIGRLYHIKAQNGEHFLELGDDPAGQDVFALHDQPRPAALSAPIRQFQDLFQLRRIFRRITDKYGVGLRELRYRRVLPEKRFDLRRHLLRRGVLQRITENLARSPAPRFAARLLP